MTARDFCYWLQGKLEIDAADPGTPPVKSLSCAQVEVIKRHLALVFAHEIDPSIDKGSKDHKGLLDDIHTGYSPKDVVARC